MKMAGINFYAPVPRVRSESLPACPRPRDNGESLVRIDGDERSMSGAMIWQDEN